LWNLLENAIKYRGPANPEIRIEGHQVGREYELRVRDNGIGMSPDEARHAFDAFYRGTRSPRQVTGTGLGLSIVKRIVDVCDGRIAVESTVDKGTSFVVGLPLATAGRQG
jgi:signal transduction histidine kinase